MLKFLNDLKEKNKSNIDVLKEINEIETELTSKKYGLIWEEHEENVDIKMKENIPVFTEVKEKQIKTLEGDYNFILEGDNLHSLKLLKKTHKGKIDVIYIDPPYNLGKDDFTYNDAIIEETDDYKHSKWLSFMYERLLIAYSLLSDDGVIFISISDDELYGLKLLCDSIFTSDNFITNFIWEKTQHTGRQAKNYYCNVDYILCYAKNIFNNRGKEGKLKELLVKNIQNEFDDAPLYNASDRLTRLVFPKGKVYFRRSLNISESTDEKYKLLNTLSTKKIDDEKSLNLNGVKYNYVNKEVIELEFQSRWSQNRINEEVEKGTVFIIKTDKCAIRAVYSESKDPFNNSSWQLLTTDEVSESVNRFGEFVGTNEEGSAELKKILNNEDFDFSYPKPPSLIKYLIAMYFDYKNDEFKDEICVLDFFAGSGTTGQAVMELNKLDNGKRKFILCTNNEISSRNKLNYLQDNGYMLDYNPKTDVRAITIENKINSFLDNERKVKDELFVQCNNVENYGVCRYITYPRIKKYIEDNDAKVNLKYYRTDFISKSVENLDIELNRHTKELVQLENAIDIDDKTVLIAFDNDDLTKQLDTIEDAKLISKLYISRFTMLNSKQKKLLKNAHIEVMPDYYFKKELKEKGLNWG